VTWNGNGHAVANRSFCTLGAALGFLIDPSTPPTSDTCD
jgi:hypothetical protein